MSQSQDDVMENLRKKQLEFTRNENNDIITISEARRNITILESLLPRVSLESVDEQKGNISSLIINIKTFSSLESFTEQIVLFKARLFTRIKVPTKDINDIRILSSRKIALPLINTPTGRTFHTVEVELE